MRRLIIGMIMLLISLHSFAQILHPIRWAYAAKRTGKNIAILMLKATIEKPWHIYSSHQKDGGPIRTSIIFKPNTDYQLDGEVTEPIPATKYEKSFSMNVYFFEKSVIFQQKIRLKTKEIMIKGKLEYMACDDHQCLPPEEVEFNIPVK